MHERRWFDTEPSEQNLASYDLEESNQSSSTRQNQTLQREEDGAIEFHKIKFYLRSHSSQVQHWSDDRWKSWQQEEVRKEDISIALMIREELSTSVLLRDTLEAILLILRHRTMWRLGVEYSIASTTLDVHSIFILFLIMD